MTTVPDPAPLEATATLLARIRAGDAAAREALCARFLPLLRRWGRGRLPQGVRDLAETDDLVQVALLRALDHVEEFEARREGAFLAYLRHILMNLVRDQIRGHRRRPGRDSLDDPDAAEPASLVEQAVGFETLATYERALASLPEEHREAVLLRIEFGYTFEEVAAALGSPSPDAARMMVTRALARLAAEMRR
jgi:RNA polymerase sigma-70 factor (ECF subfamily)